MIFFVVIYTHKIKKTDFVIRMPVSVKHPRIGSYLFWLSYKPLQYVLLEYTVLIPILLLDHCRRVLQDIY